MQKIDNLKRQSILVFVNAHFDQLWTDLKSASISLK